MSFLIAYLIFCILYFIGQNTYYFIHRDQKFVNLNQFVLHVYGQRDFTFWRKSLQIIFLRPIGWVVRIIATPIVFVFEFIIDFCNGEIP